MDLLLNAYSTVSDDDEPEEKHEPDRFKSPPPKRHKPRLPDLMLHSKLQHRYSAALQTDKEALIPGRYISKRERAAFAESATSFVSQKSPPLPVNASLPSIDNRLDPKLPCDISTPLRNPLNSTGVLKISDQLPISLNSHKKAVSSIQWSPTHAHLLASAGMDHMVFIWNVWNRNQKKARVLSNHSAAVKDVKWSSQGLCVLSCGYDSMSRLTDVETGIQKQVFIEDQVVGVTKFHPHNPNLFVSGGSKGFLRLWDMRVEKVVHEYMRGRDPILDIDFTIDAKQFIASCDVSVSNISENSIVVWDVSRQIPLSKQVYVEVYSCPCIRCHPFDPYFVAQSSGYYIATFSSKAPFKLNKYKRFKKHGVCGFPIKCNFSLDGHNLVSGSSDGCIYFYNSKSSEVIQKIKLYDHPSTEVIFHPFMPNVIASCSWNGDISVLDWTGTPTRFI